MASHAAARGLLVPARGQAGAWGQRRLTLQPRLPPCACGWGDQGASSRPAQQEGFKLGIGKNFPVWEISEVIEESKSVILLGDLKFF